MALKLHILTLHGTAFEGDVRAVSIPTLRGMITVLPRHAELVTQLDYGDIKLQLEGGGEEHFAATSGFVHVVDNTVKILAESSERDDQIDIQRAERAEQRARERLEQHGDDLNAERATKALARARLRLTIARRRRRSHAG